MTFCTSSKSLSAVPRKFWNKTELSPGLLPGNIIMVWLLEKFSLQVVVVSHVYTYSMYKKKKNNNKYIQFVFS